MHAYVSLLFQHFWYSVCIYNLEVETGVDLESCALSTCDGL